MQKFFVSLKKDKHKRRIVLTFFLFALFLILFTGRYMSTGNTSSRYIAAESIVEEGDFIVDQKHLVTPDKIYRDGHYYSSKPPALILFLSGTYYIAHNFFDQDFYPTASDKVIDSTAEAIKYYNRFYPLVYINSLIFVGGTFLLLLFYFYKALLLFAIDKRYHLRLLLGLGLGTIIFSYSITFNNHTIAASLLFVSFYYLLRIKKDNFSGEGIKKYLFLSGLTASLAAVIDLPTGFTFCGLFFLYFVFRLGFKKALYYIWPFIVILGLHLYFNYQAFGGFLPAQVYKEYWKGPDGEWINPEMSPDFSYRNSWPLYLFNIFFGTHGLLFYTPVLFFSFVGIYKTIKNKTEFFWEALMVLFGLLVITIFYTGFSRAYGGFAYGFRWFIAITPLIYFFTIFLFRKKISDLFSLSFLALLIISIIFAIVGVYNPWANARVVSIGDITIIAPPFVYGVKGIMAALQEHLLW